MLVENKKGPKYLGVFLVLRVLNFNSNIFTLASLQSRADLSHKPSSSSPWHAFVLPLEHSTCSPIFLKEVTITSRTQM